MSADGQRAHDILLSYEPLAHYGACWHYVWKAYAAAGATTSHGSLATAYDAWNASYGKHPGDRNPPPGAAIWLGRRYSDGNMAGDVFIAGQRDGDHAATDQPGWGQTGLVSIQGRINLTGREYLGWTDHVLDCPIRLGGTPAPTPTPPSDEEDDMPKNSGFTYVRDTDKRTVRVVFNTISGFFWEWSDDNIKIAEVATAFDVPTPFVPLTQGARDGIEAICREVRHAEAAAAGW